MRTLLQYHRAGIFISIILIYATFSGCGGGGAGTNVPGCPWECCADNYCDDGYTCCDNQCTPTWSVSFGGDDFDSYKALRAVSGGGYIFAGRTRTFGSSGDNMWVGRLDASASVLWHYALGGTGDDFGYGADELTSGNYVFVGTTSSFNDSNGDAWVYIVSPEGKVKKNFIIGGMSQESFQSVAALPGGGYVAAGLNKSKSAGETDAWVVRFNPDNTVMWDTVLGGALPDLAQSVRPTSDGGFVFTGQYYEYFISGENGAADQNNINVWVVKLDAMGNQMWSSRFGGDSQDNGFAIREARAGGYIVAGSTLSYGMNKSKDMFILRVDSGGELLWSSSYGGYYSDVANDVIETSDHGFVVAGYTYADTKPVNADLIIVKVDSGGSLVWVNTIGELSDDAAYSIIEGPDGGFIVAGNTASYSEDGTTTDAWVMKLDSNGRLRDPSGTIHAANPDAARISGTRFMKVNPEAIYENVMSGTGGYEISDVELNKD